MKKALETNCDIEDSPLRRLVPAGIELENLCDTGGVKVTVKPRPRNERPSSRARVYFSLSSCVLLTHCGNEIIYCALYGMIMSYKDTIFGLFHM